LVSLHIEPTSRCTLACPRCERTTFMERFGKKNFAINDIDIDALESFIDIPVESINLCGNTGDPIYHRNFIDLVAMLTKKCNKIWITTNGSYKTRKWWQQLNQLLRPADSVKFSIDGTPENFTQYRVNGDWNTIKIGIEECVAGPAKTTWRYIPFRYNEHDIEYTRKIANSFGIDEFRVEPSDRWLNDDPLKPTQHIGPRDTVQQLYKKQNKKDFEIDPQCKTGVEHYISSRGLYSPCCMSTHYEFYYKSKWWHERSNHNITTSKLSEQIRYFNEFYSTIQTERHNYCVFNCGKCK